MGDMSSVIFCCVWCKHKMVYLIKEILIYNARESKYEIYKM